MSAQESSSKQTATPINFIEGALSAQVKGQIDSESGKANFTVNAESGQYMIVNIIATTPDFMTNGTITGPSGQGIGGGPGGVVLYQALPATGSYTIAVGQNSMGSNLPSGQFIVEVIIIPAWLQQLLNQQ